MDLLTQYGPELVGAAIDNVADYVGDVDEIGSSDISAWVSQVERMLKENPPDAFAEGSVTKKPQPYNDPNWVKNLPKEKLDALAGPRYKKDKKEQGVAEGIDYMHGHCHVIAIALQRLHPDWQLRAHIGWDEEAEDEEEYRVDHVYIVAPDGTAYDCRGKFANEQELVGPDETGGVETQFVDMDIQEINNLVQRGELKKFTKQDIQRATDFVQNQEKQVVAEGEHDAEFIDDEDAWYNMADFARNAMSQGQAMADVIRYLVDNNYLLPHEVGNFTKTLRGEKWNESVAEGGYSNYDNNRTGFRKPGADVSGEGEPQGMFMVVINGRDWKEFTSNKAFTVAKTVASKNPTKQVQVRWPTGQLNTVKEGMSESDISGLMAAGRLHKEFIVKTDTKSYRVQAQSANIAKEKVIKKIPGATIVSVTEKNTETTLQENESDAVYGAILRRIMGAHLSLLSKYGPEAVMNATEEVADWVGEVDEIGTSDVSGWVRDVFNKLQAEYPVQESHSDDEYDDEEQDSELYSGCYVRDTLDGDHGEIFRMQGSPEERRVQILDRDGRGWYISPDRLAKVDDNDPAIAKYFAEDSWHAEDNAWHGGGNEAVDAWHGQSSAGPMAETEEPKKETPKTVAKTWDQMTSKEKLSGVKGRTMYNQKTSKYYVVFDVPATGK